MLALTAKGKHMCGNCEKYNDFPSVTIGGPPGDYTLQPVSPSNEYCEFQIIVASSVGVNPGVVQVSGVTAPKTLDTSGNSTYNGVNPDASIRSIVISLNPNQCLPFNSDSWDRIASPNGHIFVRIDGVVAAFVTIKRRVKILEKVPGPFTTVELDRVQDMNVAREEAILQAVYGNEGVNVEYGRRPQPAGEIVEQPGTGPVTNRTWPWTVGGRKP